MDSPQPPPRTKYRIQDLLDNSVQPLPDLEDDELESLGESIGERGPLAVPVSVSTSGRLLDGNQRLKAMLAQGRKEIMATDVRVIPQANVKTDLEWAIKLNLQRRQLSSEQKATLARRLQQRGWTQTRIAKVFGVTQGRISQLLAEAAPDDDFIAPAFVEGEDGRRYEVKPRTPKTDDPAKSPWRTGGHIYKALATAKRLLENEDLGPLTPLQRAPLGKLLDDLIEAATGKRDQLARQDD